MRKTRASRTGPGLRGEHDHCITIIEDGDQYATVLDQHPRNRVLSVYLSTTEKEETTHAGSGLKMYLGQDVTEIALMVSTGLGGCVYQIQKKLGAKWLFVVPIGIPRCMLAFGLSQNHKYRLQSPH